MDAPEKNPHGPKTMIKEIPVANERLYAEVARINKMHKSEVEEMVSFIGEFIHDAIEDGQFSAIMIPYFGKFKPKAKLIKHVYKMDMQKDSGLLEVFQALHGRKLNVPKKRTRK